MMRSMRSRKKSVLLLLRIGSIAFWLLLWQWIATIVGKEVILPSPLSVLDTFFELVRTKHYFLSIARSFWHILSGFFVGMVLGCLLATVNHLTKAGHALFTPILVIIRATPVASFILMAYFWMEEENIPALVSALMVLPLFYANIRTALEELEPELKEMLKVYRVSFFNRVFLFYLPSILPYFSACAVTGFGLAWKAGIAAEVIALPKDSLGKYLHESKMYYMTNELFATTLTVILCSLLCETLLKIFLQRFLRNKQLVRKKGEEQGV